MVGKARIEYPVSAGGVVYRMGESGTEVALCGRSRGGTWNLPKGTPDDGETIEQTALREVLEETGLVAEIEASLSTINYWFAAADRSVRYHKHVHFFLMGMRGGSLEDHDPEFDLVRWFSLKGALGALTYESEVDVVREAADLLGHGL